MMSDHTDSMKLWFDTLIVERRFDSVIESIDRIQRHRYAASQPLGGRSLIAFRWMLESPAARLTDDAIAQRKDLLAATPTTNRFRESRRYWSNSSPVAGCL